MDNQRALRAINKLLDWHIQQYKNMKFDGGVIELQNIKEHIGMMLGVRGHD